MARSPKLAWLACGWGVVMCLLAGCAPEAQTAIIVPTVPASTEPTPTPRPVSADLPVETSFAEIEPTVSFRPTTVPCSDQVEGPGLTYEVDATLDWEAHTVTGRETVSYRNESGRTLEQLVFTLGANGASGQFAVTGVETADGRPIDDFAVSETQLIIPLPERLHAHCEVAITLDYSLAIPSFADVGSHGYLGFGGRQINLGLWFPLVASFDAASDWIAPVSHSVGEQAALQIADFGVELALTTAPPGVQIAAPGEMTQLDDTRWRFELQQARDLTLSLSDQFKTMSTTTADGVKVELYYFPVPGTTLDAPRQALQTAADALTLYSELYGPYSHERMIVVEGDFPDGMEFSGLVFVSEGWFRTWTGESNDWLTIITAHEVSHQWWYALVGNDQGSYPYLDEALATYSELLFFERYYPDDVDWWWQTRIYDYGPGGYVDATVYDFYSVREYINSVYLRGALMLDQIRQDLGDEAFLAWLRQYADAMTGRLATPADLWGAMPSEGYSATETTRAKFMRQAEVLSLRVEVP